MRALVVAFAVLLAGCGIESVVVVRFTATPYIGVPCRIDMTVITPIGDVRESRYPQYSSTYDVTVPYVPGRYEGHAQASCISTVAIMHDGEELVTGAASASWEFP